MADANCRGCDHTWETDEPPRSMDTKPTCPACGETAVDVETEAGWYLVYR